MATRAAPRLRLLAALVVGDGRPTGPATRRAQPPAARTKRAYSRSYSGCGATATGAERRTAGAARPARWAASTAAPTATGSGAPTARRRAGPAATLARSHGE